MEEFRKKQLETLWCPRRVEYFEREKPEPLSTTRTAASADSRD
jgi:hypothetical protein